MEKYQWNQIYICFWKPQGSGKTKIINKYSFKRLWEILGYLMGCKSQNDLGVYGWKHWENVHRPKHSYILKLYNSRIIEMINIYSVQWFKDLWESLMDFKSLY